MGTNLFFAIGAANSTIFFKLVASNSISDLAVYIIIGLIIGLYTLIATFGMKDVVKSKEFDMRRSRSNTQQANQRVSYIIKQGVKNMIEEP